MKRTVPTLALLSALTLGSAGWLQVGQADAADGFEQAGFTFAVQAPGSTVAAPTPSDRGHDAVQVQVEVPGSAYTDAIRALLAAQPGPERDAAAQRFRTLGPEGFAALYETLTPVIEQYRTARRFGNADQAQQLEPLVRLLDTVAQQRDAYAAGLFWHTDLDDAKVEAQRTGKPILSLRMLGNLDDEYSCANSRFFRTALYADTQLGDTLRDDFILHWRSVRPVPVITIDMGDGRVLRRTITGNSCHLVLDPQGRPVDVIPGLYGPRSFEETLGRAADVARDIHEHANTDDERQTLLDAYHLTAAQALDRRWAELTATQWPQATLSTTATPGSHVEALTALDNLDGADEIAELLAAPEGAASPFENARRASVLSAGKHFIEAPLLDATDFTIGPNALVSTLTPAENDTLPDARDAMALGGKMHLEAVLVDAVLPTRPGVTPADASAEVWRNVATHYAQDATLDTASRQLMGEKTIPAEQAAQMAFGKSIVENPLIAMIQNFEGAIALDTARNEHLLHRQIHAWFVDGEAPADPDALTSQVYAELFLTPDEDPWLGLVPPDTYSALDAGGLEECPAP